MDCTDRFDRLTAEKTRHERRLNKGEVVRLSELTMWFINKGTDVIDRWCPDSVRYRKERDALNWQILLFKLSRGRIRRARVMATP